MKPFGIKHDNRIIIDLHAYRGDEAGNTDGMDDISDAPKSIEIITVGVWDTPYHGAFAITHDTLQQMIDNNNAGLRSGLPVDYEHDEDGGAAGWITNLRIAPSSANAAIDALWGDVEWTPKAAQAIKDNEYRYFSPEFYLQDYCDPMDNSAIYDNVLIGGGLTNRPLMRNLIPVTANDTPKNEKKVLTSNSAGHTIYVRRGSTKNMNLADLLEKVPSDLSDEERAFVVEHQSELSDEQRSVFADVLGAGEEAGTGEEEAGGAGEEEAGGEEAGAGEEEAGEVQASEKISAQELSTLRRQAAEGSKAMAILAKKQAHEHTSKFIVSNKGSFPVAAHDGLTDFYMGLDEKQQKQFNDLVGKLPKAEHLLNIRGADRGAEGGAVERVQAIIADAMKANEKLTLRQAQAQVAKQNPTLMGEYYKEIEGR